MDIHVASLASPLVLENNSGSARTDYLSNHNLSYRARHRRQLLKEKTSSASTSPQVPDRGEIYMSGFIDLVLKMNGKNLKILKIYGSFYFVLQKTLMRVCLTKHHLHSWFRHRRQHHSVARWIMGLLVLLIHCPREGSPSVTQKLELCTYKHSCYRYIFWSSTLLFKLIQLQ